MRRTNDVNHNIIHHVRDEHRCVDIVFNDRDNGESLL